MLSFFSGSFRVFLEFFHGFLHLLERTAQDAWRAPGGGLFYPGAQADRVNVRLKSNQSI
jgi:hypothetical protein